MANRVTIDVEARYIDRVTAGFNKSSKSADKFSKSVEKAKKLLSDLDKKTAKPLLGADDNAFTKKIRKAKKEAEMFGRTKAVARLEALDRATAKIGNVLGKARAFSSKVFKGTLSFADKASSIVGSVTGAARSFGGRTFRATIGIIDKATSPLRKIKDLIFNIKTLAGAIVMGVATKTAILNPINLADQYSGAQIGFSTLLGETGGKQMMNDLDVFAKATPFNTSNVIASAQKMMAMGWDAENIIGDLEIIGNAAAATGNLNQGLEQITRALSQIKTKGRLSTEELNQLAEAGISAKAMLAEQMGFGTGDEGIAAMTEQLEKGAIASNEAIAALMQGMRKYDGMMDSMANETAEGLWSQLQDTFEINILRKWGQGLQDGAKKGLGSLLDLLNTSEDALESFGDIVYDIGKEMSNWAADKLENTVQLIKEITATDTFKNASLGEKISILWDKVISEPFDKWWSSKGKKWLADKASGFGEGLGSGISSGLLALLGVNVTGASGMISEGASIGASFAKGFAEGFDASAVTKALVDAISNVYGMLPPWAQFLVGSYGVGKAASAYLNIASAASSIYGGAKALIGSTGNSMVQGTGLLNILANAGYKFTGGAASAGGYFGAGTAMTGGMAALAGAGGIAAIGATGKGIFDLYGSYKADQRGDKKEAGARAVSGVSSLTGVATGAALGSLLGPVGTLVGAGIGGLIGWIGGNKWADNIRTANYETQQMKDAVADSEKSAEDIALEFERVVNQGIADHFGDVKLTLEEIQTIAKKVAMGDKAEEMEKFVKATDTAAASLSNMQTAAESLDRLNWKVGLGLKLNEEEIAEYKTAIDSFIGSAKQYVEDKHYEFTASVSLLMDVTGDTGKSILESGNTFYAQLKEQIDGLGTKLSETVNIALEDGVITLDEQAEILNLQNQIAEITNKLAKAETEAGFEAIKIKFGESHIDEESFLQLQEALAQQLSESETTYEDALTVSLANLQLQLDEGVIDQSQYDSMKSSLEEAFKSNMEALELKVEEVQLEIIGDAYKDILGEDGASKLSEAISTSISENISPAEWSTDDVRKFLNADSLSEEMAGQIAQLISNMTFEEVQKPKVPVEPEVNIDETAASSMKDTVGATVSNYLTGEGGIPATANVSVTATMYGTEGISLAEEAAAGRTTVDTAITSAMADSFSASANANITLNWKITNPTATLGFSGGGGNGSTVTATVAGHANGGFINSKILSWLGEEGPEAVIPLVPGRRERGLKLWEEAGRRLGVQYHAEGGIVGGGSAPVFPIGSGEKKVEVNVGGVTIEIKADSSKTIAENIEVQAQDIAEKVAEIINNALKAQFANTPARGTA